MRSCNTHPTSQVRIFGMFSQSIRVMDVYVWVYSFIRACVQVPTDQPGSLLEVSDSAPRPHTKGFENRTHTVATTTI